jgi:23S rRNA pseudouridine2604 synthase
VNKMITDEFITGMSAGVPILGQRTKKCFIQKETPFIFRIVLVQGLNRQIRRMCEFFGYEVTKLERIRIMNVKLKGLPQGDWRDLTSDELSEIFKMIEKSEGNAPTNQSKKNHFWSGKKKKTEEDFNPNKKRKNNQGKNNNRHKGKFGGGSGSKRSGGFRGR